MGTQFSVPLGVSLTALDASEVEAQEPLCDARSIKCVKRLRYRVVFSVKSRGPTIEASSRKKTRKEMTTEFSILITGGHVQ